MPPKTKIYKEQVLKSAFELVREYGEESLNARNIALKLSCSTQPIFSYYSNMFDLKTDVFNMANKYHSDYFSKVNIDKNLLINIGLAYIDFAIEEPNVFRFLFMSNSFSDKKLNEFVTMDCNEVILNGIPKEFDRHSITGNRMFTDMWLYAHGIASMLVSNNITIEHSEIEIMIKNMCDLLIQGNKS